MILSIKKYLYHQMTKVLIIKKNGDIEEKKTKHVEESYFYKICAYKSNKDFVLLHSYEIENEQYRLYGKKKGKANHENKYELPPPIDNELFFGNICIVKYDEDDEICDVTKDEWESKYEELFGGFVDIGSKDDEERSMDSDVYDDDDYTKEGYLKDDFVVDDDELQEEDYLTDESE